MTGWIAIEPLGLRTAIQHGPQYDPQKALVFHQVVTTEPIATEAFDYFIETSRADVNCIPPVRGEPPISILADCNGIAMVNRHVYQWDIDGLPIFSPAIDLEVVCEALAQRQVERFGDGGSEFFSLSTRFWNVLLTPHQREELLSKMAAVMAEAVAIAVAETASFNERFAKPHPHLAINRRSLKRQMGDA